MKLPPNPLARFDLLIWALPNLAVLALVLGFLWTMGAGLALMIFNHALGFLGIYGG
jgi:hypothetical protein